MCDVFSQKISLYQSCILQECLFTKYKIIVEFVLDVATYQIIISHLPPLPLFLSVFFGRVSLCVSLLFEADVRLLS